MASVHKEIVIDAPIEYVWDAVRDVGAAHRRLAPGLLVDTHMEGDERVATFARGEVVRELIVAIDDETCRLAYSLIEGSTLFTYHHASMQVFAESENSSRFVWITDFLPHEQAGSIAKIMGRGAEVMKQAIESSWRLSK